MAHVIEIRVARASGGTLMVRGSQRKYHDLAANKAKVRCAGAANTMHCLCPLPVAVGERVTDNGPTGGPELADSRQHRHNLDRIHRESVATQYDSADALWIIRSEAMVA